MKKTTKTTTSTKVERTTIDRANSTFKWGGIFSGVSAGAAKDAVVLPLKGALKLYEMTPSIKNKTYNELKASYKAGCKEGYELQQAASIQAIDEIVAYTTKLKAKQDKARAAKAKKAKKNTSK